MRGLWGEGNGTSFMKWERYLSIGTKWGPEMEIRYRNSRNFLKVSKKGQRESRDIHLL